jgi:L-ascorbate metabolism protein UlaG (beta-lactamase superfamily)
VRRKIGRGLGLAIVLVGIAAIVDGCASFGSAPKGERLARMKRSPEWKRGRFVNSQPIVNDNWGAFTAFLGSTSNTRPRSALPVVHPDLSKPPTSGLRVTWLGHSSTLVELDGKRILTDPMWGYRSSPVHGVGPSRWYPPPLPIDELPPLDAVVISHDHYDHLDRATIVLLRDRVAKFFVPLGVGAHLEGWGVDKRKIVELDWWEHGSIGDVELTCVPARHASGRTLTDRDRTLWSGWAMRGPVHRVYYSGDSGLFPALRDIGARLGPFDMTLIEVGQYHRAWPDWHMGPEQAVQAHQMVGGKLFVPVHWGLFTLALHGWTEPIERALAAADKARVPIATPRPGQSVEGAFPSAQAEPRVDRWWPKLPWKTSEEDPIVSSGMR